MMDNFNGGIIDATSVILIINKLELYIETEDKIINLIIHSLEQLSNYYQGENNNDIKIKRDNLVDCLYNVLENKRKIKDYLRYVVEKYISMNDTSFLNFNYIDIN